MTSSELRSPFVDRMFNLLPQGHEEALKHAFYNVAAICSIAVGASAAMAVYFTLQPFIKPLLWAILIGSVLHPVKQRSVEKTQNWLHYLGDSNTPLVLGCFSIPFKVIDLLANWIGTSVIAHFKLIAITFIGVPVFYYFHLILDFDTFYNIYSTITNISSFTLSLESLPLPAAISICVSLLILMVTFTGHLPPIVLQIVSHLTWMFAFLLFASLLGTFKIILVISSVMLLTIALAIHTGWIAQENEQEVDDERVTVDVGTPVRETSICTPRVEVMVRTPSRFPRLLKEHLLNSSVAATLVPSITVPVPVQSRSNGYIHAALWACIVIQLWRNTWLLHLIPIPLVFFIVKSVGSYVGLWKFLTSHWNATICSVLNWTETYKHQIFPVYLRWIFQAFAYCDRMLVNWLLRQVDVVVTAVVILVVVVVAVLASVLVAVQIYGESVHLVHFGTRLVNQTLANPEAQRWFPQGFDQTVGSMVGNAYSYGQTGIATYVRNTFQEKDPVLAAQLEKTILEALDRIQRAWLAHDPHVTKHAASINRKSQEGMRVTEGYNESLSTRPPATLLRRMSQDILNFTALVNFGRENVGMIMSIAQSVWTIVKGNFSLLLQSTTAIISILMIGGSAILNFLVNGVVFLTALYYLLVASDSRYKPVQLVSLLSPGPGTTLGTAIEEAVNTVCLASLKLAAFYGLWTWLIHTLFQVNFVVIPTAIAAVLGAVPFLGTYWAALPAALDLWLAQSRGCEAILLMLFHFLPTMLVDAAFYAEIKGGGHPYLTGLAVAGGIFWLGFEGAIIGPLLLCVLLVAVSMYSSFMQETPVVMDANTRLIHRRLLRTGTIA